MDFLSEKTSVVFVHREAVGGRIVRDKRRDLYLCDSRRQYRRDPWRLVRVVPHKYFVKLSLSL